MGEVFFEYETPLFVANGWVYRARACGGTADDGTDRWHGWIEFLPIQDGLPVRTARETTQPNRTCTVYWSTGLTPVYLEGALERALSRVGVRSAAGASSFRATGRGRQHAITLPARTIDSGPKTAKASPRLALTRFDRSFLKSLAIAAG